MIQYRAEVDGLRCLAVLPVLLFHAGISLFSGGFIGVDVFFVISGYLITSILIKEISEGSFSIVNFYERRARRILPALMVVLFASMPFAWFWMLPGQLKDFSQTLVSVTLFSSNVLFWIKSGYFEAASELKPLLHTWSLAVEEQYYLFFPLLMMLLWRKGRPLTLFVIVFLSILSFIVADMNLLNDASATFYLILSRLWELGIGSIVAFTAPNIKASRLVSETLSGLGLLLILFGVFFFSSLTPFPGRFALFPTIGAALILLFGSPVVMVGRLLSHRWIVGIGLISYSLYLWHFPVFAFARLRSLEAPSTLVFSGLILLTFILAVLSYRYVERPMRDKSKVGRQRVIYSALITSVVVMGIGLVGSVYKGFPARMEPQILNTIAYTDSFSKKTDPCWAAVEQREYLSSNDLCRLGKENADAVLALVGDSNASTMIDPLDRFLLSTNQAGINYTYNTCLPLVNGRYSDEGFVQETCDDFRAWFFSHLDEIPEVIVLLARWPLFLNASRFDNLEGGIESGKSVLWQMDVPPDAYVRTLQDEYRKTVEFLLSKGKKVVLVYSVPEAGWVVPLQMAKNQLFHAQDPLNLSTSYSVYKTRNEKVFEAFDLIQAHPDLLRIKPENLFCSPESNRCINARDGVSFYYDDDHLSNEGAALLVDAIIAQMKERAWLAK